MRTAFTYSIVAACFALNTLHCQSQWDPPSPSRISPEGLIKLCSEILPASGRICYMEGKVLRECRCEDLLNSKLSRLDSMKEERKRIKLHNLSLQGFEWEHVPIESYGFEVICTQPPEVGEILESDTTSYLDAQLRCHSEKRLRQVLLNIVLNSALDDDLTAQFQFTVHTDLSGERWRDERFPLIRRGDQNGWWYIDIPAPLLWCPEITDTFLEFLILHEMGHALAGSQPRTTLASEFEADRWASFEALPAIHGDANAASIQSYVAQQYGVYLSSIYHQDTYARSTCTHSALGAYPRLSSRQAAITDPFFVGEPYEGGFTYPSDGWDAPTECGKGGPLDVARWHRGSCPTNAGKNCVILHDGRKLCNIQALNKDLLPLLVEMSTICNRYPSGCPGIGSSLRTSKELRVRKRSASSERHTRRALDDLQHAIRYLESTGKE